jgi:hypothetical protein
MKENQIFRKEDPSQGKENPNPAKEIRLKSLDFLRRIERYQ